MHCWRLLLLRKGTELVKLFVSLLWLLLVGPHSAGADVVTVNADFSESIRNNGYEYPQSAVIGSNTTHAFRTAIRFPVSGPVPAFATITKVELLVEVIEAAGNTADTVKVGAYGGDGLGDPLVDAASVAYNKSAVAFPYKPATDELRTLGSKVVDITAAALDVTDVVALGGRFTVAIQQTSEAVNPAHYQGLAGYTNTNPAIRPRLRITYSLCEATGDAIPEGAFAGFIDVKTDPHCMLAGDAYTDDTAALQQCISYWGDHRQAIDPATGEPGISTESLDWLYFPRGAYVLTNTVRNVGNLTIGGKIGRAYTPMIGECKGGVVFKLPDSTPGFTDPNAPKRLLDFEHVDTKGKLFQQHIHNISFEIGDGNLGAVALAWPANNMVSMRGVSIKANPDQCHTGILLPEGSGPSLIKGATIDGCRTGVSQLAAYYSVTLDGVSLRKNSAEGLRFGLGVMAIAGLKSYQPSGSPVMRFVPVGNAPGSVVAAWGIEATGGEPGRAIVMEAATAATRTADVYLRDVQVTQCSDPGYKAFTQTLTGNPTPILVDVLPPDYSVDPILTMPVSTDPNVRLPDPGPLRLTLPDHPTMVHADPNDWQLFPAGSAAVDSAPAIEAAALTHKVIAINGAHWIGETIDLCGAVERVIGFNALLLEKAGSTVSPVIRVCAEQANLIAFESVSVDPDSGAHFPEPRLVVEGSSDVALRDTLHLSRVVSLHGGDVYEENTCCSAAVLDGGKLTFRALNVEDGYPPHDIEVSNGEVVGVGVKHERGATSFHYLFTNSVAEIFGGFLLFTPEGLISNKPPIQAVDSDIGLYGFAGYSTDEWNPEIKTTDGGVVRTLPNTQPTWANRRFGWTAFRHSLAPVGMPVPFAPIEVAQP